MFSTITRHNILRISGWQQHIQLCSSLFKVFKKAGMPFFNSYVHHMLVFTYFMIQPLSEVDNICQTIQVPFDKMLCGVLEKYHSFPGSTLLLGGIFQYMSAKQNSL